MDVAFQISVIYIVAVLLLLFLTSDWLRDKINGRKD
jgi:hypothetical protein